MSKVNRVVSVEEQRDALLKSMIVAPVRALGLLRRAPELAQKRGWPPDGEKGHAYIACVVGAVKIGARDQRFKIPEAFLAHDRWFALAATFGTSPRAIEVVEAMDLDDLLEPA